MTLNELEKVLLFVDICKFFRKKMHKEVKFFENLPYLGAKKIQNEENFRFR